MSFRLEHPLGFDGRLAARARRRNRLSIRPVLDITGVKDTGNVCSRAAMVDDKAFRVQIKLAYERLRVRHVSDGQEEAVHILLPSLTCLHVLQSDACHHALLDVENVFDHCIQQPLIFGIALARSS